MPASYFEDECACYLNSPRVCQDCPSTWRALAVRAGTDSGGGPAGGGTGQSEATGLVASPFEGDKKGLLAAFGLPADALGNVSGFD